MHREGHIGAALALYSPLALPVAAFGDAGLAIMLGVAVAGLCMVPDLDMKLPMIRHRGPTHTVRFVVASTLALAVGGVVLGVAAGSIFGGLVLGVVLGTIGAISIGSHLLADMLTPAGVDVWGDGNRVSYNVANASNPMANYALLALGVGAVGLSIGVGSALPF